MAIRRLGRLSGGARGKDIRPWGTPWSRVSFPFSPFFPLSKKKQSCLVGKPNLPFGDRQGCGDRQGGAIGRGFFSFFLFFFSEIGRGEETGIAAKEGGGDRQWFLFLFSFFLQGAAVSRGGRIPAGFSFFLSPPPRGRMVDSATIFNQDFFEGGPPLFFFLPRQAGKPPPPAASRPPGRPPAVGLSFFFSPCTGGQAAGLRKRPRKLDISPLSLFLCR